MKISTGETEGILSEHGGEYDLADDAAPPPKATRPQRSRTLAYAGTATPSAQATAQQAGAGPARGAAADPNLARAEYRRNVTVPLLVCGFGTAMYMAAGWGLSGDPIRAAVWVSSNVLFEIVTVGLTLLIATWMLDDALGDVKAATLKVAALVVGPAGVSMTLLWVDQGHLAGGLVGFFLGTLAFCALLTYLLEFEFPEVATTIGVHLLVTLAANGIWLATIGTWGYVP